MTFKRFVLRTLFLLFLAVAIALLWSFRSTWILVFLALILAIGVSIPVSYLRRINVPRPLAVIVSAVITVLLVGLLSYWLVPSMVSEVTTLLSKGETTQLLSSIREFYTQVRQQSPYLAELLPPLTQEFDSNALSPVRLRELVSNVLSTGLPILVSGGSIVATLLANLFLVFMLVIFFLAEPRAYVRGLLFLLPERHHAGFLALLSVLYHTLRTWLSTLMISISITMTLVVVVLGLLGMPNVFVVAAIAGVATFVPNIGAILPVIPIAIFMLAEDPSRILVMVFAYLAIQLLESNVLTPSIVRRQLSIPPAATLVTQILAGFIFGLIGVLLAVPLLASIITIVREVYAYGLLGLRGRPVEVALPDPTPHARDTRLRQRAGALQTRLNSRKRLSAASGTRGQEKEQK